MRNIEYILDFEIWLAEKCCWHGILDQRKTFSSLKEARKAKERYEILLSKHKGSRTIKDATPEEIEEFSGMYLLWSVGNIKKITIEDCL